MSNDYVGVCKCGGLVFWVAEERAKDQRKEISKLLKDGFSIERMETEKVKEAQFCRNHGKCVENPELELQNIMSNRK